MAELPSVPETLTVHLGAPGAAAPDVTVSFPDYIKNVASSEIYPTWPENAIRANILAQVSFTLNRVYTEYYRSLGYPFDITNSTRSDQAFVEGRDIFENVSRLTDELFTTYIRRKGSVVPLFAAYCNGTSTTCAGLSQWGSVSLANAGRTPFEILQTFYGEDIELEEAPVRGFGPSLPPDPLRLGSVGNDVLDLQIRLNRISENYPSIPKIPVTNGVFEQSTLDAVLEFQHIFSLERDGIVGRATWYRVLFIFTAVKRLNELDAEGVSFGEIEKQYPDVLSIGMTGVGVEVIQYFLALIGLFEDSVPAPVVDGIFGQETEGSVRAFQARYGLEPTGIVDRETYRALYDVYLGILRALPPDLIGERAKPYPGNVLVYGSRGEDVTDLQTYLRALSEPYGLPEVGISGFFDPKTRDAVTAVQRRFGIPVSGAVGATTWARIASLYDGLLSGEALAPGQFPGIELKEKEGAEA